MMRKVPVWALEPGMKIARPIYDARGTLLLNSGLEVKNEYIDHLQMLGIPAIYIEDRVIPDVEIEDVILDETRQKAKKMIHDFVLEAKKQPEKSIPQLVYAHQGIKNVLQEIVDQLLANPNLIINLADIRSADDYTFAHSVNVAVIALIIGISMRIPRSRLRKIGLHSFA